MSTGTGRAKIQGGQTGGSPGEGLHQDYTAGMAQIARPIDLPGTWNAQTYDNVTTTLQSKDLPAGAIALRATYYGVTAAAGVAMGIAIDAATSTAGEAAIDAGTTPQVPIDGDPFEWDFVESTAITRVDFKSIVAESGTSKFVLEWKVAV